MEQFAEIFNQLQGVISVAGEQIDFPQIVVVGSQVWIEPEIAALGSSYSAFSRPVSRQSRYATVTLPFRSRFPSR